MQPTVFPLSVCTHPKTAESWKKKVSHTQPSHRAQLSDKQLVLKETEISFMGLWKLFTLCNLHHICIQNYFWVNPSSLTTCFHLTFKPSNTNTWNKTDDFIHVCLITSEIEYQKMFAADENRRSCILVDRNTPSVASVQGIVLHNDTTGAAANLYSRHLSIRWFLLWLLFSQ